MARRKNQRRTFQEHVAHKTRLGFLLILKIFFAFFSFFVLMGLLSFFLPWVNLTEVSMTSILVLAACLGIATTLYLFLILKVLHLLRFR